MSTSSSHLSRNSSPLHRIVIVAGDGISLFHLAVPCMVFQDAFLSEPVFDVTVCSIEQASLAKKSGYHLEAIVDLSPLAQADMVIICGWGDSLPQVPAALVQALRNAYQRGAVLVGLCLGAFVLAETGLLDHRAATTHWGYAEPFRERFPRVNFDAQPLFIDEGQLVTSAGIAASIDCCLHLLRRFIGIERANQVARLMVTAPFRFGGQQQYIPAPLTSQPRANSTLEQVVVGLTRDLATQHTIDTVAERCAMSRRTFTRKFKAIYGTSFNEWLTNQRLNASQYWLENSHDSIAQIARRVGFRSESVYRKQFKAVFNLAPAQWRLGFTGRLEVDDI
ncbi:helix-turn-helix domain-containing protein [Vibrio sp. SM6]|uniref:Helix-turn-helix domain-containing protein n=1 Tax=Vibrio agarilyticus TaxID=2726741 RepID=A0A7X8TNN7_9VIBR|nr:helix-turn-helix domain-containing protein [Vibrio agarilyticus]NLS12080.1 helix-turn-helix domain-containing protein [Vibrio agarilyticus]